MPKVTMPEPDAYIFQHEETGQIHEIDAQQVEWGFEKNNPRLKPIGILYSSEKMESYANARVRAALEEAAKDAESAWRLAIYDFPLPKMLDAIRALIPK